MSEDNNTNCTKNATLSKEESITSTVFEKIIPVIEQDKEMLSINLNEKNNNILSNKNINEDLQYKLQLSSSNSLKSPESNDDDDKEDDDEEELDEDEFKCEECGTVQGLNNCELCDAENVCEECNGQGGDYGPNEIWVCNECLPTCNECKKKLYAAFDECCGKGRSDLSEESDDE